MQHSTHRSTQTPVQWAPTPEEAKRFLEVLACAEAYPRRSRFGGVLRRVA